MTTDTIIGLLLDAAPDGMLTVDGSGRIARVNRQLGDLFGYRPGELEGRELDTLIPERFVARHQGHTAAFLKEPRRRGMGVGLELFGRRKDGTEFPVEISLSPLGEGDARVVVAAVRDRTEHVELERLRREALERRNAELHDATQAKSHFLRNMSHELRTPLNSIVGFSELLLAGVAGDLAERPRQFVTDILTSAQHLNQLIRDLLDLHRIESGHLDLHFTDFRIQDVIGAVAESMRGIAADRGLDVSWSADFEDEVRCDRLRLKQIIYNYLSNAVKFTHRGTVIRIHAHEDGDGYRIDVQDDGPGISAEDQARLFVDFGQLDAGASKRHQGTGLGLAISRELGDALGGRVGVRSALGVGSTFWVWLPRDAEAATASRSA